MTDTNIEVSVVMGSESDLPTMQNAIDTLSKFNINQEIKTVKKERNEAVRAGEMERSRHLQEMVREMQVSLNQAAHTSG